MPSTHSAYPPEYFDRHDSSDDKLFYHSPRMVVHIDETAIAALTQLFDELLPDDAHVLDLMSSWRSHLPPSKQLGEVIGLGMNSAEMEDNPQLTSHIVQNLNEDPVLTYDNNQFDAVLCTVSVQYLVLPIEVFQEAYRVLKPGGVFVLSFSHRCFPNKAIAAWVHSNSEDHIGLVHSYFQFSAEWRDIHARIKQAGINPPTDPLYMLWAYKNPTE